MPPPRALSEFVAEANEVLETLAHDLAVLDAQRGRDPEPDLLNAVFRAAHSLKGLSAMFGQEKIAGLAHHLEDVLDALRLGKVQNSDALVDTLLEGVDVLTLMLREAAARSIGNTVPFLRWPTTSRAWRAVGRRRRPTCSTRWASTPPFAPSSRSTKSTAFART